MSIEELEEKVKEKKPDVIFIDFIQCLKMPQATNLSEAINLAIKEVKRIALENDLIVVLTSPSSRATEFRYDKTPLLSDLKNGGFLEDFSDVVLMIYRGFDYDSENLDWKNRADVVVVKNKFGDLYRIPLTFAKGVFSDYPDSPEFL